MVEGRSEGADPIEIIGPDVVVTVEHDLREVRSLTVGVAEGDFRVGDALGIVEELQDAGGAGIVERVMFADRAADVVHAENVDGLPGDCCRITNEMVA